MAANVLQMFIIILWSVKFVTSGTYKPSNDMEDVDMVLKSDRLLNNYIKCILDVGPCTAAGREIRMNIPDAIVTNCNRCSKEQVEIVKKIVTFIIRERPQDWEKIVKKFDPQGKYRENFDKFLKNRHVKID